jgi:hypothetical protein
MATRELFLLSPYKFPAQNAVMLGNDEVAAFLNAHAALWHPAATIGAKGPPRIESPYDHEQPSAGQIFAVPEIPPLVQPDKWEVRVRDAGAIVFRATPDRQTTLSNLLAALRAFPDDSGKARLPLDATPEVAMPFIALGFGYRMVESLFEAMEHDHVLSISDFWLDIQAALAAVQSPDDRQRHLQAAADRLLKAREVVYPVEIRLLDLAILDDKRSVASLPLSVHRRLPCNLLASSSMLETLARQSPETLALLRERVASGLLEVCGGPYIEREDAVLPLESQLWTLRKGQAVYKELLGQEVAVFARKRFGAHPQLPLLLNHMGLRRALLLSFDESVLPTYRATVVSWSSPDGKQVDAFVRTPHPADTPPTFFHWAHYLHRTIAQDHAATLALVHRGPPAVGYEELVELSRFGPVLGTWTTFSQYFNDVLAGEYASAASPDEFHGDYLTERTEGHIDEPIGWFARHCRLRRRVDAARTWTAMYRGLSSTGDLGSISNHLDRVEDAIEQARPAETELGEIETETSRMLAERLLSRASGGPGYLVLNPCSFPRRVIIDLPRPPGAITPGGPLKTYQVDADGTRAVIDVPALGFAWLPAGDSAVSPPSRMRLADARSVRNEYFEAEIDPHTGGLRGLRDHQTRVNRIGQQLVFNPGSQMRAREIRLVSSGPARGEVASEGDILDEHENVLARFRQRFCAWLGRPILDLYIEIELKHPPSGYPWHAYYGARFAWRDERAMLVRGSNGVGYSTNHTRPETPDYLELRLGRQTTTLFPGGLPFHQRHGARMLDVILAAEGETIRSFHLALGLDREYPMQTAVGLITPVTVVPAEKGPPHIGATGWLFHVDAPNLILTRMWPDPSGQDAILFGLVETHNHLVQAELRCPRNPIRGALIDRTGAILSQANICGDGILFEVAAGDCIEVRADFQ